MITFRSGKDIDTRMTHRVGTLNASYNLIKRIFGHPTYDSARGDEFDGIESKVWNIQFEDGLVVRLSDAKEFGVENTALDSDVRTWRVQGYSDKANVVIQHLVQSYQKTIGLK